MRYRWILAAIMVVMIFCTGCGETLNYVKEPVYSCTPEQRIRAQQEALNEVNIRRLLSEYSRNEIYQEALKRNCEVKP